MMNKPRIVVQSVDSFTGEEREAFFARAPEMGWKLKDAPVWTFSPNPDGTYTVEIQPAPAPPEAAVESTEGAATRRHSGPHVFGTCATCLYWTEPNTGMCRAQALGFGICQRINLLTEFEAMAAIAARDTSLSFEHALGSLLAERGILALTQDGSDYSAWIYCQPSFGCNMWRKRNGETEVGSGEIPDRSTVV